MTMHPHTMQPHSLGHVYEDHNVTVFFGNRQSTRENVAMAFPDYRLLGIRQTHSDIVIESPYEVSGDEPGPEADAHFTRQKRLAISIRTADCVPVLIYEPSLRIVAAIHAGWRGVENEIIRKTCARLARATGAGTGVNPSLALKSAQAWIGPHIGAQSFEVGLDVAARLEARFDAVRGYSEESTAVLLHDSSPDKRRVDLLRIVRGQLRSYGIEKERTMELAIDTVASTDHESFRRDREKSGRQLSFIALK